MGSEIQSGPPASTAPKVHFYFGVDHRLQYACRILRKARTAGKSVLVFARDAARLARFDTALWTFSALDFLPHVYADSPLVATTPIVLSLDAQCGLQRDILLQLDDELAEDFGLWFERFERVVEVVSNDEDDRTHARARFQAYRNARWVLTAHQVEHE